MHAAVITAYKDAPTLLRLVRTLRAEGIAAFVHIDAKSRLGTAEMAELRTAARLVVQRHRIYWGSYSHLAAIIELMRAALDDPQVTYLHILSGQDFPVGRVVDATDPAAILMDVEPLEVSPDCVRDRVRYRKLAHAVEGVRWLYRPLDKLLLTAQRMIGRGRQRSRVYDRIYKGIIWMSLPRDAARHCLEDTQAQRFLREVRGFYLPEEFFFPTVLMNARFRDAVVPSRRFTIWAERHGVIPGILDIGDLPAILRSDSLFARKIDSRISAELLDALAAARPGA